ncbi:hypothetical protein V1512DRAFT_255185 [Lipomyces arxii]|uniref:uncharacterized protein n=1 Tax=Lipomyces arxii TaxID=56418 RepID=UPI0034CE1050
MSPPSVSYNQGQHSASTPNAANQTSVLIEYFERSSIPKTHQKSAAKVTVPIPASELTSVAGRLANLSSVPIESEHQADSIDRISSSSSSMPPIRHAKLREDHENGHTDGNVYSRCNSSSTNSTYTAMETGANKSDVHRHVSMNSEILDDIISNVLNRLVLPELQLIHTSVREVSNPISAGSIPVNDTLTIKPTPTQYDTPKSMSVKQQTSSPAVNHSPRSDRTSRSSSVNYSNIQPLRTNYRRLSSDYCTDSGSEAQYASAVSSELFLNRLSHGYSELLLAESPSRAFHAPKRLPANSIVYSDAALSFDGSHHHYSSVRSHKSNSSEYPDMQTIRNANHTRLNSDFSFASGPEEPLSVPMRRETPRVAIIPNSAAAPASPSHVSLNSNRQSPHPSTRSSNYHHPKPILGLPPISSPTSSALGYQTSHIPWTQQDYNTQSDPDNPVTTYANTKLDSPISLRRSSIISIESAPKHQSIRSSHSKASTRNGPVTPPPRLSQSVSQNKEHGIASASHSDLASERFNGLPENANLGDEYISKLIDRLVLQDAKRSARETEILNGIAHMAGEMRHGLEAIRHMIVGESQLTIDEISHCLRHEIAKLRGPRPYTLRAKDTQDVSTPQKNMLMKALASVKSNSNMQRVEDLLIEILAQVENLDPNAHAYVAPDQEHSRDIPESPTPKRKAIRTKRGENDNAFEVPKLDVTARSSNPAMRTMGTDSIIVAKQRRERRDAEDRDARSELGMSPARTDAVDHAQNENKSVLLEDPTDQIPKLKLTTASGHTTMPSQDSTAIVPSDGPPPTMQSATKKMYQLISIFKRKPQRPVISSPERTSPKIESSFGYERYGIIPPDSPPPHERQPKSFMSPPPLAQSRTGTSTPTESSVHSQVLPIKPELYQMTTQSPTRILTQLAFEPQSGTQSENLLESWINDQVVQDSKLNKQDEKSKRPA